MTVVVGTSLPPLVDGQLRCFLSVKVGVLEWCIPQPPKDVQVRVLWWGEVSSAVLLRPEVESDPNFLASDKILEAHYPVRCGPKQFNAYLKDMKCLLLDVVYGNTTAHFAKLEIPGLCKLSARDPLYSHYNVICSTANFKTKTVGRLYVSLAFKSISDAYNMASKIIPTTDKQYKCSPKKKKRLKQGVVKKVSIKDDENEINDATVKFPSREFIVGPSRWNCSREDMPRINGNPALPNALETSPRRSFSDIQEEVIPPIVTKIKPGQGCTLISSPTLKPVVLHGEHKETILGSLLNKGQHLREAMIKSNVESQRVRSRSPSSKGPCNSFMNHLLNMRADGPSSNEHIEHKAVDLLFGKEDDVEVLLKRFASPVNSEMMSEDEDPFHDSSLLSDLFYTTKPNTKIDESSILFSDDETPKKKEKKGINVEVETPQTSNESKLYYGAGADSSIAETSVNSSRKSKICSDEPSIKQLTNLGRVKSAKLYIKEFNLASSQNGLVYFIEYNFPLFANLSTAFEVVKQVSRKVDNSCISFDRFNVFPMFFDEKIVEYWWRNDLCVQVFVRNRQEKHVQFFAKGFCKLRDVLQNEKFFGSFIVEMYANENVLMGQLKMAIELISDYRNPLSSSVTLKSVAEHPEELKEVSLKNVVSEKSLTNHKVTSIERSKSPLIEKEQQTVNEEHLKHFKDDNELLQNVLLITEGKDIGDENCHSFCVGKVFWNKQAFRTKICWDTRNPCFEFQETVGVTVNETNVLKMMNNFMVVEVWEKSVEEKDNNKLIGMARVSLHQLYVTFKDPVVREAVAKSEYPVISFDGWTPIVDVLTSKECGSLKVLLAVGSHDQIINLLHVKSLMEQKQQTNNPSVDAKTEDPHNVVHELELQMQLECCDVRNEEADCFLRYDFPIQQTGGQIKLSKFKSKTVVNSSNPSLNHKSTHIFTLPVTSSLSRILITAIEKDTIVFELWKRAYYPNVTDRLLAKGSFPFTKIHCMISLEEESQYAVKTFTIALHDAVNDEKSFGTLTLTLKYTTGCIPVHVTEKTANITVTIHQCCGLMDGIFLCCNKGANNVTKGMNTYLKLSCFGTTRESHIYHNTFAPAFNFSAQFSFGVDVHAESQSTVASQLEESFLTCEVWHRFERGCYKDVLIGTSKIPLKSLLSHRTGEKCWHTLHSDYRITGGVETTVAFTFIRDRDLVIKQARQCRWNACYGPVVSEETFCHLDLSLKFVRLPREVVVKQSVERSLEKRLYVSYKVYDQVSLTSADGLLKELAGEFCCQLNHVQHFQLDASLSLLRYFCEESLEMQFWMKCVTSLQPRHKDVFIGSAFLPLKNFSQDLSAAAEISGTFHLFKSGCECICNAQCDVTLQLNMSNHFRSLSSTSSQDSLTECHSSHASNCGGDVDDGNDLLSLTIYIDEALHLPRHAANAYVSYNINELTFTRVCRENTRHVWNFHKLERVDAEAVKRKALEFKVWSCVGSEQEPDKDVVIGVAQVDVTPLFAGMLQLLGWYNVVDVNRQTVGQMKLGVIPSASLSPSKAAKFFKKIELVHPVNLDMACFSNQSSANFQSFVSQSKSTLLTKLQSNLTEMTAMTQSIGKSNRTPQLQKVNLTESSTEHNFVDVAVATKVCLPFSATAESDGDNDDDELQKDEDLITANNNTKPFDFKINLLLGDDNDSDEDGNDSDEDGNDSDEDWVNNFEEFRRISAVEMKTAVDSRSTDEHFTIDDRKYEETKLKEIISDAGMEYLTDVNVSARSVVDEDLIDFNVARESVQVDILNERPIEENLLQMIEEFTIESKKNDGDSVSSVGMMEGGSDNARENMDVMVEQAEGGSREKIPPVKVPNFFMKPGEMAESMKALRLAANFRKSPRQGRYKASHPPVVNTFKEKVDEKIDASELNRIANIFSCT